MNCSNDCVDVVVLPLLEVYGLNYRKTFVGDENSVYQDVRSGVLCVRIPALHVVLHDLGDHVKLMRI